jgi:hypothetical protein
MELLGEDEQLSELLEGLPRELPVGLPVGLPGGLPGELPRGLPGELPADNLDTAASNTLLDALIDRHGTGRVMFRNRRAQVGGFPRRVRQ